MKTLTNTGQRHMIGGKLMAVAMAVVMVAWAPSSVAADDLASMFTNGEFDVNFRYRYEFADLEGLNVKSANASTLRTRLVFKTAKWNDLDVTINMDDVRTIIASDYNSTRNGKTQYSPVLDPKGTDLNIAALTYSGLKNTTIVGGRQRIIRGNARFIGNVGWRQNEQTYDALSANYKGSNFSANYAYIDRVNRIFGPDAGVPTNKFKSDSHILDAGYTMSEALSVSVYGYFLDFKNAAALSSQTIGARISGAPKVGDFAITYAAEYAQQEDYGDNTNNLDAGYLLGELGFKWSAFSLTGGYEVLEGTGVAGEQFLTPLATLHAHNGWADVFVATPADGLQDMYLKGTAKFLKGTWTLVLHDFSADNGSASYGQEIDFAAKWKLGKNYSVLAKLAMFSGDDEAPNAVLQNDVTKAWLQLTAAF
ncbi:MAG: hypothetical protein DRR15_13560 [Gammaproteobacteria bacterium]|nr:MAG: hypothetical protein DRR15_13560 [Gammaproteobacteria bacterium]